MSGEVLAAIKDFVGGETSPTDFRNQVNADTSAFERFLSHDPNLDPTNYVQGSVFQFILKQDLETLGGALNVQGALADFMERNGISFVKTPRYQELFETILSAQPDWLGVDPDYVHDHVLPSAQGLSGAKLREWLEYEFRERFK